MAAVTICGSSGCTAWGHQWGDTPHLRAEKPQEDGRHWSSSCMVAAWSWSSTEETPHIQKQRISPRMMVATAKSLQSCPTLSDPMDCSLPGSSIHGIFQARVLGWVAIAFSKRAYAIPRSAAPRAPASAAVHCWPVPPQETLKHSSVSINT